MTRVRSTFFSKSLLVGTFALCASSAISAPIILNNHGFETGDLTGWDYIGEVVAAGVTDVTTDNGTNYTLSPFQSRMAYLNGQGASVTEIEEFLGIEVGSLYQAQIVGDSTNQNGGGEDPEIPEGPEDGDQPGVFNASSQSELEDSPTNGNYELTNGSAIAQTFTAQAGDTISMSWNYVARDYIPYTDPSFAILIGPDGEAIIDVLASTTGPGFTTGSDGISGVFNFTEELTQDGEYTLAFAVTNSGDDVLNPALFLDNGVSECVPNCNDIGSPENPLLPEEDDTPEVFDFTFEVTEPSTPIFIDPIVAVGYDYVVHSGPNVASVILPNIGDGEFDLYGWDGSDYSIFLGSVFAGVEFNFAPGGVDRFRVLGIETEAGIDPTDANAFITGLTFVDTGTVDISQTPLTVEVDEVPAPVTLPLLAIGLFVNFLMRRKSKR